MNIKRIPEHVLAAIDNEPWLITRAGAEKIREIASRENIITPEVLAAIEERRDALATKRAARLDGATAVTKRDGVAIIDVNGVMMRYADLFSHISGGVTTETIALDFNAALADPGVGAILLNFDSPGGQAKGINELQNMIYAARGGDKPIGGYIGGDAGSAAYWVASAVDPGLLGIDAAGVAGSIGAVIGVTKDIPGANARSVTFEFVSKQSPNKRLDPETEAGQTYMQERADALGGLFVDSVGRNRDVSADTVMADFGGGKMLMGEAAKKAGLVDTVTSMEAMIRLLKDRRQQQIMNPGLGRPRVAAAINPHNNRGASMKTNETPAAEQPEITATAISISPEVLALQAQIEELKKLAEAATADAKAANIDKLTTQAKAKVEAWKHEGALTGDSVAAVEFVYVAAMTGQPVTGAQIEAMVAKLPRFDTTRLSADAVKPAPHGDPVTDEDRRRAAIDPAAARRVAAANASAKK